MVGKAFLLDQDSFAGAPTNSNKSDEAKEKAVPHSVTFEEDKEYVAQHLLSNNQSIKTGSCWSFASWAHQNSCQTQEHESLVRFASHFRFRTDFELRRC